MQTSKITNKQGQGNWPSKYGLMYKWDIEFENGDCGEANTKDEDGKSYIVGETIDYEITDTDHGKRIKKLQVAGSPNSVKKGGSNASFALSYAKDLVIGTVDSPVNHGEDAVMAIASKFKKWLDDNS